MNYDEAFFSKHLDRVIRDTDISMGHRIEGKVRDSYIFNGFRLLVATDRLSAFDRVLTEIPFKGEVLTKLSLFWFELTRDIVPNHVIEVIAENAVMVKNCEVIPLEVIVRGYLTGSMWRSYRAGEVLKDFSLSPGLCEYYRFPIPIVCFTTKAAYGEHDEPVGREEILSREILSESELERIVKISLALYARGNETVRDGDLILVDTKYEFGRYGQDILLVDEVHTQDSSRYIRRAEFEKTGGVKELDKEYFRKWLMERGYRGDGDPPEITDGLRVELIRRYVQAYARITGQELELTLDLENFNKRMKSLISDFFRRHREGGES